MPRRKRPLETSAELLDDHADILRSTARAPRTRAIYDRHWINFVDWTLTAKFSATLPLSATTVRRYLAALHQAGTAVATGRGILSALRQFHIDQDLSTEHLSGPAWTDIFRGWARDAPSSSDQRAPITADDLLRLLRALPHIASSPYECDLFRAAFSLAFHGLLRPGEYVRMPGYTMARVRSAHIAEDFVRLDLAHSKTSIAPLSIRCAATGNEDCPVRLFAHFISTRPRSPHVLCHANASPLTYSELLGVLARTARHAGIAHVTPHCFRIGGATSAAEDGASISDIQRRGRWTSPANAKKYIRLT